jgi:putative transcriptional regulator
MSSPMHVQNSEVEARYEAALFDFSTGTLPAGHAFVVAAHLALQPSGKEIVDTFDATGGALLDELAPAPLKMPDWLIGGSLPASQQNDPIDVTNVLASLDEGRWRRNLAGMLVKPVPGAHAQLLKLEAGRSVPHHGHHGLEMTLVLSGSFGDGHGVYRRGDLVVHDEDSEHQPCAVANQDCICLISQTAPVRLNGPVGWLIKRFWK